MPAHSDVAWEPCQVAPPQEPFSVDSAIEFPEVPSLVEISAVIGPDGGLLSTPDSVLTLHVPAGAVDSDTAITLTPQIVDAARDAYTLYEFSLSAVRAEDSMPLLSFNQPVDFVFTLPDEVSSQSGAALQQLSLLWFNQEGQYWYAVDTAVDLIELTARASSDRLGTFELAADPLLQEDVNESIVYPVEGGILAAEEDRIEVTLGAGDVSERALLRVDVKDVCEKRSSDLFILKEFELTAVGIDRGGAPITSFDQPVELRVEHTLEELIAYDPDSLGLYRLDELSGEWVKVPAEVDAARGLVVAQLDRFSTYSTQAETDIVFPPGNQYFQVDMHSGAATVSIPIDLPGGPGGFGPSLSLNYASSGVDEMKTNKTMASWVGAGWSLAVPTVIKDPFAGAGRYFLVMNGVADLLVRENAPISGQTYRFYTKRHSHLHITGRKCLSGVDTYYEFFVRTRDGTEYQFGTKPGAASCANADAGTSNAPTSLQYYTRYWANPPGWHKYHYRMDVSRIKDPNGNIIDFTYWQDVKDDRAGVAYGAGSKKYVRAAYPSTIQWGANGSAPHVFKVTFTLGYDWDLQTQCGNADLGQVRRDAPIDGGNPTGSDCPGGTCSNFSPHVMETRFLDFLTVQTAGGVTIRSYDFSYFNAPRSYHNSCPVSGSLSLTALAQKGIDGGTLRTMTFSYENKAVRYQTSSGGLCSSPNDGAQSRPFLTSATNGFGGSTSFAYTSKFKAIENNGCGWTRQVVNTRTLVPGSGQPNQQYTYSYAGDPVYGPSVGLSHPRDAEFRGFASVTESRPGGDSFECAFRTDEYYVGLPSQCTWRDGSAQTKQVTNNYGEVLTCDDACDEWEPEPSFYRSKFIFLTRSDDVQTGRGTYGVSYIYDNTYGNVTQMCEYLGPTHTTPCGGSWNRRTVFSFAPNSSLWIVSLPYQTQLQRSGGSVVSQQRFYYDNQSLTSAPTKGNLTKVEIDSDSGWRTLNIYGYDSFGNRTSITNFRSNSQSFTTSFSYTCNNTVVSTETNAALNLTWNYAYNSRGCLIQRPERITDPSGVTRDIRYDQHGRVIKEWITPDTESSPTYSYEYPSWDDTSPSGVIVRGRDGTADGLWEARWFDGLGRLLQTRNEAISGTSTVDTAYDAAGNVASESIPYYSTAGTSYTNPATVPKTQYAYDVLGRVMQVTNPDTTVRSIEYQSGAVRYRNERGFCTDHTVDSFGRTTTVKEFTTTGCSSSHNTTYLYDERDLLTRVTDAAGNQTNIEYDKAGWKKTLIDPDTGTWRYTHYNDGLLNTQVDPRGIMTGHVYDALGRVTGKLFLNYPDGSFAAPTVFYTYDTSQISCPNSPPNSPKGRLTKVQEWAETVFYCYDSRGRMSLERHRVAGVDFAVEHSYDSLDRETLTVYPDGENVNQQFDTQGMPNSVFSALRRYLTSSVYNAAFLPEELNLTGSISLQFDYRPSDFRLQNIRAGSLLNMTYGYDGVGNVTSINDSVEGKTASYVYDYADRLTSVDNLGETISYTYNSIGNLTSKQEGSTTRYTSMNYGTGGSPPRPHALTSAFASDGNHTYEYDAMGNLVREQVNGRIVHEFNYDAAGNVYFRRSEPFTPNGYDYYYHNSDGTLVRKVSVTASGGGETLYIGDIYEKNLATGEATKYYFAGGRRIAMAKVASSGVHTFYYLANDHLGGTAVVLDTDGNLVNRVRYYPFGNIRSQTGTLVTDRLYTGQQRQGGSAIYHYRARFYNADIGRFLQADPLVPGAGNPQTLNRYSYVLNNPLRYTDPSGLCFGEAPVPCDPGLSATGAYMLGQLICCEGGRATFIIQFSLQQILEGYAPAYTPPVTSGCVGPCPTFSGGGFWQAFNALLDVYGFAGSFVPGVGEADDVITAVTGCSILFRECGLSVTERLASGGALFLPFVGGGVLRHGDEAVDIVKSGIRGSRELRMSAHALERIEQRGLDLGQVQAVVRTAKPFRYFHAGVWKTGYYDPKAGIFVAEHEGTVLTVLTGVSPKYIDSLRLKQP